MIKKNLTRSAIAQIWERISNYGFEDIANKSVYEKLIDFFGSTNTHKKAFARKLSEKRGWDEKYSARVIEEYLRFTFLGIISDFQVTPCAPVDEAWHQHQLFTASYRNFCNDVLQTQFDHRPGLIESEESGFTNNYSKTYEAYRRHFNQEPPADIWPKPKQEVREKFELVDSRRSYGQRAETYVDNGGADDTWLWWIVYSDTNLAPHVTSEDTFDGFGGGSSGGGGAGSSFETVESVSSHSHESTSTHGHSDSHSSCTSHSSDSTSHSDSGHSSCGSHSSCSSSSCSSSSCSGGSSCGGGGGD